MDVKPHAFVGPILRSEWPFLCPDCFLPARLRYSCGKRHDGPHSQSWLLSGFEPRTSNPYPVRHIYMYMCVCIYIYKRARAHTRTHTHTLHKIFWIPLTPRRHGINIGSHDVAKKKWRPHFHNCRSKDTNTERAGRPYILEQWSWNLQVQATSSKQIFINIEQAEIYWNNSGSRKKFTRKEDSRNRASSDSGTAKLHSLSEVRGSVASYDILSYDNFSSIQVKI